jgi:hypothetical protein
MAERLLRLGLGKPAGEPRNYAIARAVAMLAENIERRTQRNWRDDQWTGQALRYAVEALVYHYAPTPPTEGAPAVPSAIEQAAGKMPPEFAERFSTTPGFGHTLAQFLIQEIEQAGDHSMPDEWTMPIFFSATQEQLALISRDLGSVRTRKEKSNEGSHSTARQE